MALTGEGGHHLTRHRPNVLNVVAVPFIAVLHQQTQHILRRALQAVLHRQGIHHNSAFSRATSDHRGIAAICGAAPPREASTHHNIQHPPPLSLAVNLRSKDRKLTIKHQILNGAREFQKFLADTREIAAAAFVVRIV